MDTTEPEQTLRSTGFKLTTKSRDYTVQTELIPLAQLVIFHLQNKQTNISTCGPRKPLAESGPLGINGNDRQKANNFSTDGKRLARMTAK